MLASASASASVSAPLCSCRTTRPCPGRNVIVVLLSIIIPVPIIFRLRWGFCDMRTFVPDHTWWSLLLTALAIRLRNKPTYDKLRVLIINKDIRKSLTRKNGNENPIWSWNDSLGTTSHYTFLWHIYIALHNHQYFPILYSMLTAYIFIFLTIQSNDCYVQ